MRQSGLTVDELMTPHVITLDADDNLDLADMIMKTARVRHLPVVREGKLVGMVTHRDLLRASVSSIVNVPERDEVAFRQRIRANQIMTADVVTVLRGTPALDVAKTLMERRIGCVVVTTEDGTLAGIVTESDFLQLAVRALEQLD